MVDSGDTVLQPLPRTQSSQTQYRRGFVYLVAGAWLLHEATIFGVLLHDGDAWVYFPLFWLIAYISDILSFPYLAWGLCFSVFHLVDWLCLSGDVG